MACGVGVLIDSPVSAMVGVETGIAGTTGAVETAGGDTAETELAATGSAAPEPTAGRIVAKKAITSHERFIKA